MITKLSMHKLRTSVDYENSMQRIEQEIDIINSINPLSTEANKITDLLKAAHKLLMEVRDKHYNESNADLAIIKM